MVDANFPVEEEEAFAAATVKFQRKSYRSAFFLNCVFLQDKRNAAMYS